MNVKNIAIGLLALIFLLMALIIYQGYRNQKANIEEAAYWRKQAFKTDTVFMNDHFEKYYESKPIYKEAIPPKSVILYQPYIPDNILQFRDSLLLVVDSLKGVTTSINPLFLRRFPGANKLISATFKKDSLNLDLLNLSGDIITQQYPVDYSAFNYQYQNNSLRGEELNTRLNVNATQKKSLIRYDGTYLFYDRDFIKSNHKVSATVGFDIWKFRVQGWSQYELHTQAGVNAGLRLGYRLF